MNKACVWKEEMVVDYLLGELPTGKEKEFRLHVKECINCQERLYSWYGILGEEKVEPSSRLKERIDKSIEKSVPARKKKFPDRHALSVIGSAAMLFIVVGLFQLILLPSEQSSYVTKQNEEVPEDMSIIHDPQTVQFHVTPVADFDHINGSVWVNDNTNELLLDVKGLRPLDRNDYQVWLVKSDNPLHDELLETDNDSSQLYYRGEDTHQIQFIRVSIEPEGGSSSPTGPETLMVDLDR